MSFIFNCLRCVRAALLDFPAPLGLYNLGKNSIYGNSLTNYGIKGSPGPEWGCLWMREKSQIKSIAIMK